MMITTVNIPSSWTSVFIGYFIVGSCNNSARRNFFLKLDHFLGHFINKHFKGSCELLGLNLILILTNFVQTVCKHRLKEENTSFCTFRVDFIAKIDINKYLRSLHKISLLYKCKQYCQSVQNPVYCTNGPRTSLLCTCTQLQTFQH